ncbi:hypothetical protein [Mycoplasma seminis]|uniref:DUF4293 family protein n=1 Tax=Mycoplasma seminis TaxID=512749 RepID=A0ABY9HA92_9MOLU|nr:hypothetical protein [Mycoplasma seminis]WLP85523.1 hypothetical protein Q8852_04375 [Mycoplasma seminis]
MMKDKNKLIFILTMVFSFITLILFTFPDQLQAVVAGGKGNKIFLSFWDSGEYQSAMFMPLANCAAYFFLIFTFSCIFEYILKENRICKIAFRTLSWLTGLCSIAFMIAVFATIPIDAKLQYTKFGLTPAFVFIFLLFSFNTFIWNDLAKFFKINEKAIWKDEAVQNA